MTVQSRFKYKLAFKTKLVLEAVHSGPIADWKRALQERAADVFGAAPVVDRRICRPRLL